MFIEFQWTQCYKSTSCNENIEEGRHGGSSSYVVMGSQKEEKTCVKAVVEFKKKKGSGIETRKVIEFASLSIWADK